MLSIFLLLGSDLRKLPLLTLATQLLRMPAAHAHYIWGCDTTLFGGFPRCFGSLKWLACLTGIFFSPLGEAFILLSFSYVDVSCFLLSLLFYFASLFFEIGSHYGAQDGL